MDEDQDAREKLAHDALGVLKRDEQLFAAISIEVMDGIDVLNKITRPIPKVQTDERLAYALRGFHLRAGAYLKLVSDLAQQEAFIVLLQTAITDAAWWDYIGARVPIAHLNAAMVPIRELVRVYLKLGYERIATPPKPSIEATPVAKSVLQEEVQPIRVEASPFNEKNMPTEVPKPKADTIGAHIKALFDECDITIEELAGAVGIDPTNISRHMRGLAKPSRKSRMAYNKAFSKLLKREVILPKTQPKRR
jgi:hypothetical protein